MSRRTLSLRGAVRARALRAIERAGGVPATDPDFASVVLLLDFAGADEATNITDLSATGHAETFVNEAQVDTAVQSLEQNSLKLDGTGASNEPVNADLIRYANHNHFNFGTGDFTVEFHFRQNAASASTYIFISNRADMDGDAGTGGVGFDHVRAAIDDLRIVVGGSVVAQSDVTFIPTNDIWYHLAYVRSGTNVYFFIDGVQLGSTIADVGDNFNTITAQPLRIGGYNNDRFGVNGYMANVRITKGVARYTANFTPPTEFYPLSA